MINKEIINEFFENNLELIQENIQKEYHKRIKQIQEKKEEERNNIKMSIISELYYKKGFEDGINYIVKLLKIE